MYFVNVLAKYHYKIDIIACQLPFWRFFAIMTLFHLYGINSAYNSNR